MLPFELLGFGLGAGLRDMLVAGRRGDGGELVLFHELRSGDGFTGVVGLLGDMPIRYTGGVICAGGAREVARGLVALPEGAEEAILEVEDAEVEDDRPLEEGVTKEDATAAVLVLADEPDEESRTLDDDPMFVANLLRLPPGGGIDGGEMSSLGP